MRKANELREISNDNVSEEVLKRELTIIENQLNDAAEGGKFQLVVFVPLELADKIFQELKNNEYGVAINKAKQQMKLTITW